MGEENGHARKHSKLDIFVWNTKLENNTIKEDCGGMAKNIRYDDKGGWWRKK